MNRGWALVDDYPQTVRRTWPEWALRQAHSAYSFRRLRDPLTVAMESEYQRRSRLARAAA